MVKETIASEIEKIDATLAAIEAEEQARLQAGAMPWPTVPVTVVDEGKTLSAFAADAPQEFKSRPEHIEIHVITPEPVVQAPSDLRDHDDAGAINVTPPWRPPPAPPPSSEPWQPATRRERILEANNAIRRREQNFHDGDWGNPQDHPLRYGRRRWGW